MKNIDEFIKSHVYIGYCEAIIDKNGKINYATPSHIYKLIELSGYSKNKLDEMMPIYASPLEWFLGFTGCISVWYDNFQYSSIAVKQRESLQKLVNNGVLSSMVKGYYTDEYTRCNQIEAFNKGLISEISPRPNVDVLVLCKSEVYYG